MDQRQFKNSVTEHGVGRGRANAPLMQESAAIESRLQFRNHPF